MTDSRDPLDRLAAIAPRRTSRSLGPGEDPRADALLAEIRRRLDEPPKRKGGSRRRWRWLAAGLVVGGAVGGTAAAIARLRPTTDPIPVACWADDTPTAIWPTSRTGQGFDADALCAEPWTNGTFGTNGAPSLVACISSEGIAVIMPGEDGDCRSLGLADFDADADAADRDSQIAWHLADRLIDPLGVSCKNQTETRELITQTLQTLDAEHWAIIQAVELDGARPCGAVVIDRLTRTVRITGRPDIPSAEPSMST